MAEKTAGSTNILGGKKERPRPGRGGLGFGKRSLICADEIPDAPLPVKVIGGDTDDTSQDSAPTIIIEKEGERIARILVKCPCGRHSELRCEYDDK